MLCFRTCESARIFRVTKGCEAAELLPTQYSRLLPPPFPTPPRHRLVAMQVARLCLSGMLGSAGAAAGDSGLHAAAGDHLLRTEISKRTTRPPSYGYSRCRARGGELASPLRLVLVLVHVRDSRAKESNEGRWPSGMSLIKARPRASWLRWHRTTVPAAFPASRKPFAPGPRRKLLARDARLKRILGFAPSPLQHGRPLCIMGQGGSTRSSAVARSLGCD